MSFESDLVGAYRAVLALQLKLLGEKQAEMTGEERMRLVTRQGSGPWPWVGPGPDPAIIHSSAAALFVSGAAMKQIALNLPEGAAKRDLLSATQQSIADWEDDYCGTPPRPIPSIALAAELATFANELTDSTLRTLILDEAGQIAQKGLGAAAPAKAAAAAKR